MEAEKAVGNAMAEGAWSDCLFTSRHSRTQRETGAQNWDGL